MKNHLIYALLAAVLVAGCTKNEIVSDEPEGIQVSVSASKNDSLMSRTYMDPSTHSYYWSQNDQMGLFVSNGTNTLISNLQLTNNVAGQNANSVFTGTLSTADAAKIPAGPQYSYWAYYPYQSANVNDGAIQFTLPSNQSATADSFNGAYDLMVSDAATASTIAVSDPATRLLLHFKHVFAFLEVPLTSNNLSYGVTQVQVTFPSGCNVVGVCSVNPADGTVSSVSSGSNVITVSIPSGMSQSSRIWIPIVPQTVSGQVTITLTNSAGASWQLVKNGTTFRRAKIYQMSGVSPTFRIVNLGTVSSLVTNNSSSVVSSPQAIHATASMEGISASEVSSATFTYQVSGGTEQSVSATVSGTTLTADMTGLAAGKYTVRANVVVGGTTYQSTTSQVDVIGPISVSMGSVLTSYTNRNNSLDGLTIYTNANTVNMSSSYYSYITEAGLYVDGTKHTGSVSNGSFNLGNYTGQTRASHTVQAYAVVAGTEYKTSTTTVYVTGIPYIATPPTESLWTKASWNVSYNGDNVQLGGVSGSGSGAITMSNYFYLPADINVSVYNDYCVASWGLIQINTTYTLKVSGTQLISVTSNKKSEVRSNQTVNGTLTTSNNSIECKSSYTAAGPYSRVYSVQVRYR